MGLKMRFIAAVIAFGLSADPSSRSVAAPAPPFESSIVDSVGFVRGRIAGKSHWFLIDTGANRSAFDSGLVQELGLQASGSSKVEGTAGQIAVRETLIRGLQIGKQRIAELRPTVQDLAGIRGPNGERVAGILGLDVLRSRAVLWDRENKRVNIAATAIELASLKDAASVPFVLDNGIPRIRVEIDGIPLELRIDTGAAIGDGPTTFVNITQAQYDRLRAKDPTLVPYTHFTATGAGGEIRIPVVKAHSLRLAGAEVAAPRLIVQPSAGYFARSDAVGFLGGYAFNEWRGFIVDYGRKRLLLLPQTRRSAS